MHNSSKVTDPTFILKALSVCQAGMWRLLIHLSVNVTMVGRFSMLKSVCL